jgi:hypothetical protein
MIKKKQYNSPNKLFKEPDELIRSRKNVPVGPVKLISIRRSEIMSIAPDDINWDNIYSGKTAGLHSIEPETQASREDAS